MSLLITSRRALLGGAARLQPWDFDLALTTFTAGMAKRNAPGPFTAAPIVQGKWDGTGTPDVVSFSRGSQIVSNWYANVDPYQGSIVFWITPEWDGDDGKVHYIYHSGDNDIRIWQRANGTLRVEMGSVKYVTVDTSGWIAGTAYNVVVRWDIRNALDGTNHICLSINDSHTFSATAPTVSSPAANLYLGSEGGTASPANGIIEGLTVYRRPLWDGTYGVDVGNGDEINLIYAAGAGKDPTEITGAWDVCFCAPTDSAVGALATGNGNAWSMPHADNLLTDGFCQTAYGASAWGDEGTPLDLPGIEYNGTTTSCVVTDAAAIQDLHDAAFTAEAWIRADGWGESDKGRIFDKTATSSEGWRISLYNVTGIYVSVFAATTDAQAGTGTDEFVFDGRLHHIAMQFDDGGDRKVYLWIDGIPVSSYYTQIAAVGAVVTDVGNDLCLGIRSNGQCGFDGFLGGWARISNVLRYTNGKAFVPSPPTTPPAVDGNTAWQTDYSDGAGAVLTDDSGNGNNGALTNHTWVASRDMDDAEGEKNYEWGYITGSDAADEGITQTLAGSAGDDMVVRTHITPSADGTARPYIEVYDEIGAASIVTFYGPRYNGTHTGANNSATLIDAGARWMQYMVGATVYNITDGSSATITAVSGDGTTITAALSGGTDDDWDTNDVYRIVWPYASGYGGYADHPWAETFTFELPAGCTSYSVKALNAAATGTLFVHQLEVYDNLITNPSMAVGAGNPWIPTGWTNDGLGVGDTSSSAAGGAVIHAGSDAIQFNAGAAAAEGVYDPIVAVAGGFYAWGAWLYGDSANGPTLTEFQADEAVLQATLATAPTEQSVAAFWAHVPVVVRALSTSPEIEVLGDAAGALYGDDFYAISLDAVSLTVTPASEANSAESGGIRVDGRDNLTQPIPVARLKFNKGWIRFKVRPRHAPAELIDFLETTNSYFAYMFGDANNYISLYGSAANQITLGFNAGGAGFVSANWACAAAWTADQEMIWEIRYNAASMWLVVDEVTVVTVVAPVAFGLIPTIAYWGGWVGVRQGDAVFLNP